ncbi:MAG: hypothetical protein HY314_13665 [Acidobacteria bacterium]|nr:hypothetical protein [Acidobacteriota bacterium]
MIVYRSAVEGTEIDLQQYNVVHRAGARRTFCHRLDVHPVREGSPAEQAMLAFFQSNRRGKSIGILEVKIHGD